MAREPGLRFIFFVAAWILFMALVAWVRANPTEAAQPPACTSELEMITHLDVYKSELPVVRGQVHFGGTLIIAAAQKKNTWTLIFSQPDGVACIILSGSGIEFLLPF